MAELKYKVIKSKRQYLEYCDVLEKFASKKTKSTKVNDEIELLTALIERWDKDHNTFENTDPISLIKSLLKEHNMTAQDLVKVLKVSKGLVPDILNYKKGLSKETVRKLAAYFQMDQAAFNRQYSINKAQQNKSLKWLAKQAQELNLGYEPTEKIKPILYHSFEEKEKLEKDLLRAIPEEKRNRLATELMSIFHTPKKARKSRIKKSLKKRSDKKK